MSAPFGIDRDSAPPARRLRREAWVAGLFAIVAASFAGTTVLVRHYRARLDATAEQWYRQGESDLDRGDAARAVGDFRDALAYRSDNFRDQFALARALIAVGRGGEARSYLVALRTERPEDGAVNFALARLAAQSGSTDDTVRYYQNAIYGIWPATNASARELARRELIEYLLAHGERYQADAEILAEAQTVPNTAAAHTAVAQLLLRADDVSHALDQFRQALRLRPNDAPALAGAGEAAFQLGDYAAAHRSLVRAVARYAADPRASELLAVTDAMAALNPYAQGLTANARRERVRRAVQLAGARLGKCAPAAETTAPSALAPLAAQEKTVTRPLRRATLSAGALDAAMTWVFAVEEHTAAQCGTATSADDALLLLGRQREQSPG